MSMFHPLLALSLAALSPELQLAAQSLRPGEQARLERAVGPLETLPVYRVDLAWAPDKRQVAGAVSLTLQARATMREVLLRVPPNATHEEAVTLSGALVNGSPATIARVDSSLFRVRWPVPVDAGGTVQLDFKVRAQVPVAPDPRISMDTADHGGDYGAFSASEEVTCLAGVIPQVAPVIAGKLEGGPSGIGDLGSFDPSNFLVSVAVPSGYSVVAPGLKMGEVPEKKSGVTRFSYAVAGAREFPILVTQGYEVQLAEVGDITVESHFDRAEKVSGKKALEIAARAIEDLNAKLGPYPFRTLRVVEARLGGGAGGMEFPGLVTVSTALYRGAVNPLEAIGMGGSSKESALIAELLGASLQGVFADTLEFTIDHEVAHQYFAMLVGSDPLATPVADEPLTQHVALLLREWHHGKKAADDMRTAQLRAAYQLHRMMGGEDAKANQPTRAFTSNTEYAAAIYGKAPLMFDAQRALVGDPAWTSALRTYVSENRYRWVGAKTFTELVSRQNPKHAQALEATRVHWWEETHGDEDIAGFDLASMLGGGAAGGPSVDPALIKEYEKAMKALMGEEP